MADAASQASKSQTLVPQFSSDNANPSKLFRHFLYKAVLFTVILVLLPLFPSLAPEFINQTVHARSWELLQLIFVGIAVSYGLFSKKNDEIEKDHSSKLDTAHSYVSKLLQVSSVFDDESEDAPVIDDNRVQTWSSQYCRGKPVVVVAKEGKEGSGVALGISQKPLLLPVRSLKQRVSEPDEIGFVGDLGGQNGSGLTSGSERYASTINSRKLRSGEFRRFNSLKEENLDKNVVLRSPVPWRSRSGRMIMKENGDGPPSLEEPESIRPESSRSFSSHSPDTSSKNLSEYQAKSREEKMWRKNFSSPPPAPPPPPIPRFLQKSVLVKSSSSVLSNAVSSEKVLRRSARSVPPEELSETEMEEPQRRMYSGSRLQNDGMPLGKSVRTFKYGESVRGTTEQKSNDHEAKFIDKKEVKNDSVEKVSVESSDEDSEDDYLEGPSGNAEAGNDNSVNDVGPDVNKKADEFIAKFREQIRLQRIESIRRSTALRAGNTLSGN